AILSLTIATGTAHAQSSGNFSATGTGASCVIGTGGALSGGTVLSSFTANLSTGSGNGTTLDLRPALVTGLFTRTKIDTSVSTASADVGIQVCITVDGSGDGVLPAKCAIYDQRFQQVSSQLFSQLSQCVLNPTGTCTTNADCATGEICNNPTQGTGTGTCVTPNPLCNFELILSTLSAHSFDFVVPVANGKPHVIQASWKVIGQGTTGDSSTASCVGPGILTVTQAKVFNNSGSLSFGSN
ncbi:MAG TPA: hypothetical protein VF456_25410, partial [Vicinamibacterales bacterium]